MPPAITAEKTTVPARTRATRAKVPAKAAAPKAAPATAVEPETADELQKVGPFELAAMEPSKNFAKFDLKYDTEGNETGCVGTVYAPLGTTSVKVVYYGSE